MLRMCKKGSSAAGGEMHAYDMESVTDGCVRSAGDDTPDCDLQILLAVTSLGRYPREIHSPQSEDEKKQSAGWNGISDSSYSKINFRQQRSSFWRNGDEPMELLSKSRAKRRRLLTKTSLAATVHTQLRCAGIPS